MGVAQGDVTINNIHVLPKINDQFVVCNKTNTVCIMNTQGQVLNIVTLTKFSKYVLIILKDLFIVTLLLLFVILIKFRSNCNYSMCAINKNNYLL